MSINKLIGILGLGKGRTVLQKSPFYGKSKETRERLLDHIRAWRGPRVKTSKVYRELDKARDGLLSHPSVFGGCDESIRRIKDYCEYNSKFLISESSHAEKEHTKLKAMPRENRLKRGYLAEVRDVKSAKKNVLSLGCSPLPTSHGFVPGQFVTLIIPDYITSVVLTNTLIREKHDGMITKLNQQDNNIFVDFSDKCSNKSGQANPLVQDLVDGFRAWGPYDIEIAFNSAAFDSMEAAISEINDNCPSPHLWLMMFLESMYSTHDSGFGPYDQLVTEVEDICGVVSAHNETQEKLAIDPIRDIDGDAQNECVEDDLRKILRNGNYSLNDSQERAVVESLANYLSLVQGPPGCGKTHTAACMIKVWLESTEHKKKALVLAQSNKAVDQLCSAMQKHSLNITRVGSAAKLQENIKSASTDAQLQELIKQINADDRPIPVWLDIIPMPLRLNKRNIRYAKTLFSKKELIDEVLRKADVICATCIGSSHEYLRSIDPKTVGLIVIDEATQASELECLVPLTAFPHSQIVMIGDHKQLPPTILSHEAKKGGKEYSLFGRLIEFGSVVGTTNMSPLYSSIMLDEQYRMHPDISAFPNTQFYNGKLSNGVTARQRPLPEPTYIWPSNAKGKKSCVAFYPTGGKEIQTPGKSFLNRAEADVVVSIVKELLRHGLKPGELGVITPYMGQVVALKEALQEAKIPVVAKGSKNKLVEVNTVDAFQGSEKDVIIISTVRANKHGQVGFLKDKRRMNVALTRAKRGLIVIGDPTTLKHDPCWNEWLQHHKANYVSPMMRTER